MKRERMKTKGKKFITFIMTLSLLSGLGIATPKEQKSGEAKSESSRKKMKISFKISGGYGYLLDGAGDLNRVRQGTEDAVKYLGRQDSYSTSFNWKKSSMQPNFKADIILNFSRHFSLCCKTTLPNALHTLQYPSGISTPNPPVFS